MDVNLSSGIQRWKRPCSIRDASRGASIHGRGHRDEAGSAARLSSGQRSGRRRHEKSSSPIAATAIRRSGALAALGSDAQHDRTAGGCRLLPFHGARPRQALWEARALDAKSAARPEAMHFRGCEGKSRILDGIQAEPQVLLPTMRDSEHVVQGLSHPDIVSEGASAFLPARQAPPWVGGHRSGSRRREWPPFDGGWSRAGAPAAGHGQGGDLMTMEDETGVLNVMSGRRCSSGSVGGQGARLVTVRGRLQSAEDVSILWPSISRTSLAPARLLEAQGADSRAWPARTRCAGRASISANVAARISGDAVLRRIRHPVFEPGSGPPLPTALVPRHVPAAEVMPKGGEFSLNAPCGERRTVISLRYANSKC